MAKVFGYDKLVLQRAGRAQYVILGLLGDNVVAVDHFNDDRCLPCIRLIEACNDNMGFSGRNDMIAECVPLMGNTTN
jgi:hypothetical protein